MLFTKSSSDSSWVPTRTAHQQPRRATAGNAVTLNEFSPWHATCGDRQRIPEPPRQDRSRLPPAIIQNRQRYTCVRLRGLQPGRDLQPRQWQRRYTNLLAKAEINQLQDFSTIRLRSVVVY